MNLSPTPTPFVLFAFLLSNGALATRKISVAWNPHCPREMNCSHVDGYPNSANSLLHFTATPEGHSLNETKTAHVLFSNVGGPAILMLLTNGNGRVEIDWSRFLDERKRNDSVTVKKGHVFYSMAVMFSRIWRFNDAHDQSDMDSPSPPDAIESIPLEGLLWKNVTVTNGTFRATLASSGDGDDERLLGQNGTLRLTIEVFDSFGRASSMPRLPHTDIGCQLDVELVKLHVSNFTQPRFALETVAVSERVSTGFNNEYKLDQVDNIDDEYTPGVFRTYYLTMPKDDGFLVWKPVAYKSSKRSFDSFTRAKHSVPKLVSNTTSFSSLNMSNLISAYYGAAFSTHAVAFNVTLGLQKDKFYTNYRYLVWSLGIGWGSKPPETLSTLILTLLIVCGMFPVLALFVGLPYLIIRRKRQSVPYEDLIDDS